MHGLLHVLPKIFVSRFIKQSGYTIQSMYGEVPPGSKPNPHRKARDGLAFNSAHHAGTHPCGKDPCCVRGTAGVALHPEAARIKQNGDVCIEKHYYSAFTETTLHPMPQQWKVSHLIICGVTTNNCVAATLRDAFHLGYDVVLAPDACAQIKPSKLEQTVTMLQPIV